MLDSFLVALTVVTPMALLMGVGVLVRTGKILDRATMRQVDKLTFRVFMPVLLFKNIYETDLSLAISGKLLGFVLVGLTVVFGIAMTLPPRVVRDRNQAASIGQGIIRSNYILFGIAVAESLYGAGNVGTVAMLGAIVVPMTNAMSVILLEKNRSGNAKPGQIFLAILKNPMVIAALAALFMQLLPLRLPELLFSVICDIAGVTTTISFISLGVSLDLGQARENVGPLSWGVAVRMLVVPALFLPLSVALGFRNQELCALMVVFSAPAAVASYPMAVAMGADGPLSGQLVCVTTMVSVFTIFCFTFVLRTFGLM